MVVAVEEFQARDWLCEVLRSCVQWVHSGVCPREPLGLAGLCLPWPSALLGKQPKGKPDKLQVQSPEVGSDCRCQRHKVNERSAPHMQQ